MKRDYKLFIDDIRNSIIDIEEYMKGVSKEDFKKDKMLQDAVIRRFEIIGEATRNIPRSLKEQNKHVPWFGMVQFRELIAHGYFEVSLNRVWSAIKEEIPEMKEKMSRIKLV